MYARQRKTSLSIPQLRRIEVIMKHEQTGKLRGREMSSSRWHGDLAYSHANANLPCWKQTYEDFFGPGITVSKPHTIDCDAQRKGVDRTVVLDGGKAYRIDEKSRREDYGDILLEYESDSGKPGWICKPLECDYIAYAVPGKRPYMLPEYCILRLVMPFFLTSGTALRN